MYSVSLAAGFRVCDRGFAACERELLFDSQVSGFFALEQLRAQVAVCGFSLGADVNSASFTPLSDQG